MDDYFIKNRAIFSDEEMELLKLKKVLVAGCGGLGCSITEILARTLMKDYDLLILDEPTASMDQASIPAAEKMVSEYRKRTGCTILLITHSPDQAHRLASSVITLEDGKKM